MVLNHLQIKLKLTFSLELRGLSVRTEVERVTSLNRSGGFWVNSQPKAFGEARCRMLFLPARQPARR